jgi:hypothetical protein
LHIEPLADEERALLVHAHDDIVRLNEECLLPLESRIPQCKKAVDPYVRIGYRPMSGGTGSRLLPQNAIEAMGVSFSAHHGLEVALDSVSPAMRTITEEEYSRSVFDMRQALQKEGVFKTPEDLSALLFAQGKDSAERTIARHVMALACIQASLSVLDQLLYQAILSTKLPTLDQNNIIDVEQHMETPASRGLSLLYQPGGRLGHVDIGELVLVDGRSIGCSIGQLWQVEALSLHFSQEFGSSARLTLREIDEDLNPFGPLLKCI